MDKGPQSSCQILGPLENTANYFTHIDASVVFIDDEIDLAVYRAEATIAAAD
jgi:hypothetical protein